MILYKDFVKGCKRLVESGFVPGSSSSDTTIWSWWVPEGEDDSQLNRYHAVMKCICIKDHDTCCYRPNIEEAEGYREEEDGCSDFETAAILMGPESREEWEKPGRIDCPQQDAEISNNYVVTEFHICYSASYQEPVLYIHAYLDSGTVLGVQDIKQHCVQVFQAGRDTNDRSNNKNTIDIEWPTMTQESHPVTQSPCYMVHPCDTRELMERLLQGCEAGLAGPKEIDMDGSYGMRYIVAWLSIVGRPFGLVPTVGDVKQYFLDRDSPPITDTNAG